MIPWPDLETLCATARVPAGYELTRLRPSEAPELAAALAQWFPEIAMGAESRHLDPAFYTADVLALAARHEGQLVALVTFTYDPAARTLAAPMGAAHPAHRGTGIGALGWELTEVIARSVGAELVQIWVTLQSQHQQLLAERYGYTLCGIAPGRDRAQVEPGVLKRVYEALYVKVLVSSRELTKPAKGSLTAKTQALFDRLFPG